MKSWKGAFWILCLKVRIIKDFMVLLSSLEKRNMFCKILPSSVLHNNICTIFKTTLCLKLRDCQQIFIVQIRVVLFIASVKPGASQVSLFQLKSFSGCEIEKSVLLSYLYPEANSRSNWSLPLIFFFCLINSR